MRTADWQAPHVETNALYHGDNLDILRQYVLDGSIDLVHRCGRPGLDQTSRARPTGGHDPL